MNQKTRFGAAALLTVLLLTTAVSCGDAADTTNDTTDAATKAVTEAATADPDDPYAARMNVSAGLPEGLDFGGAHLRSMVNDTNDNVMANDIYIDQATGEIVDDALYNRRVYVEELLNVVIDPSEIFSHTQASSNIRKSVNAGDDAYDLYLEHMIQAGIDTLEGLFRNWYDIPHTDFTHPWYPQDSIKNITLDGTMYLLLSDVMLSSFHNTYCYYFNRKIAADYDLPDVYDIVRNGQWTLDKVSELTKGVYKDVNGDGTHDADDQYGYATSIDSNVVTYFWAFDVPLLDLSSGKPVLAANNERAVNTVTKLDDFFFKNENTFIASLWTDFIDMFVAEKVLFIPRCVGETQTFFREMENYGMLPFPKYDEAQDGYYTMLDGCSPLIAVPKTAQNVEMIGAVMEAMGEYSYKYVVPAYYDMTLKVKGTRDENSIEMLDITFAGRVVDFAFVYDNWKGYAFALQNVLKKNGSQEYSSYYKSNEKKAISHFEKVYEQFQEGGE
ncbi:MAG: hypothetical protein E7604_14820 [Ruminococcaceae bacterium]|nr:hypothetical protein [Oscillospiraceae bacterium]